ncbi:MAG: YitT family protein [Chlamydiales bacterium]|nr:YitT family protein [Chlamydiales bacterium]
MHSKNQPTSFKFGKFYLKTLFWFVIGAALAAFAIDVVLIPNRLIDGGVVGISMMAAHLSKEKLLPLYLVVFNAPFVFLALKQIGKHFVIQMFTALILFAISLSLYFWIPEWLHVTPLSFNGSDLEVIILGGFILGIGIGLIIRNGGSTDGTEIMGIIVNRKRGFSVGQVILASNIVIFAIAGFVYKNWHTAFMSLMTYVVATKVMDMVIVGFEDTKSAMIISSNPQHLADVLMKELGIGLTVMYGRGGFTGDTREILYVVVERLQLAELKELVHREDPSAFIAIENLHEVINGRHNPHTVDKKSGKS